ncbi:MAG: ABC transporter substrate-binding protein [Steroidobacteraceae bacterium]
MRRQLIMGGGAALGGLLLSGCGKSPPAGKGVKVVMGVSGRPDEAFLQLALERGYFERQNLDVSTVHVGGSDAIAPLSLNQIQVVSTSPNATFFNALNRGVDVRILADKAHVGGPDDAIVSIMVRKDLAESGAVKTARDLKGRTVSLGTGRGNFSYVLMNSVLTKNGMSWNDIELRNMSLSDVIVALSNNVIDAGYVIEPLRTVATLRGMASTLITGGSVEEGAQLAMLFGSPEFAKQTDVAARFLTGYLMGVRDYYAAFFLKQKQEEAIELLTSTMDVKDPEVWRRASPQHMDLNGQVNIADVIRQAQLYKSLGDISGPVPDVAKYVETAPLEQALQVLGRASREAGVA